jgi:hypothetical protein
VLPLDEGALDAGVAELDRIADVVARAARL